MQDLLLMEICTKVMMTMITSLLIVQKMGEMSIGKPSLKGELKKFAK